MLGLCEGRPCWVQARRPFFAMADLEENARRKAAGKKEIAVSPITIEVVHRIDALFAIERSINGQSAYHRKAARQAQSAPLVADLEAYIREQCAKLSRGHDLAKAMHYMFKRWGSFTRFKMAASAFRTTPRKSLRGIALAKNRGYSAGPTAEGVAPPPFIVSSSQRR
jgi:transposase